MGDSTSINARSPPVKASSSVRRALASGLCVATVGSVLLAAVESTLALASVHKLLQGEPWLAGLFFAAIGKAAVTHLLVWCPVMAVCGLVYTGISRRWNLSRPEPVLVASFALMAGLVVVPADLGLASRDRPSIVATACVSVVVVAAVLHILTRWALQRLSLARLRLLAFALTGLSAAVTVASGAVFVRSPLFNPSTYRLAPGRPVEWDCGRPHVLLIVLDTVRADRLSCYGYEQSTTPFLDRWASQAVVFERAMANGIWTVPSHASIFTGLPIRAHGTDHANPYLDDGFTTVADVLSSNGYATAAISANFAVAPATNLTKGFQVATLVAHARRSTRFSLEYLCEKWGVTPLLPWIDGDYGAALNNHLAARWLDHQTRTETPLFLFINYMEAHLPYRVPKCYRRYYMTSDEVRRSYALRHRVYGDIVPLLHKDYNIEGAGFLQAQDCEIIRKQYAAAIRYLDDRVREVIEMFEQRGLLHNTLVIITSDHGEYLGTHGMWSHCFLAYSDVAHVPLLLREPARQQGLRIASAVELSDIYQTILGAAVGTAPPNPGNDSRDLLTLARAGGAPRIAITEYNGPMPSTRKRILACRDPRIAHRAEPQIAATDGCLRFLSSDDGRRELYDLAHDPGELHNLTKSHPEAAQRLSDHIDVWYAITPAHRPTRPSAALEPHSEVMEALRCLGYVDERQPTRTPHDE